MKEWLKKNYEFDGEEFEPQTPFIKLSLSDLEQLINDFSASKEYSREDMIGFVGFINENYIGSLRKGMTGKFYHKSRNQENGLLLYYFTIPQLLDLYNKTK